MRNMWKRLETLTVADWIALGVFFGLASALMDRLADHLMAKQLVIETEEALRG